MKKLACYITPKVPDSNFTIDLCLALYENGVDIVELGVPFSDPVADGVIIEGATKVSLANGCWLGDLFDIGAKLKEYDLLFMGYMNPFYRYGMTNLATKCQELGIGGLSIPDLPFEEANAYRSLFRQHNVEFVEHISLATKPERIATICKEARKFVYLVAYTGGGYVDLSSTIATIRSSCAAPIFVGNSVDRTTAKQYVAGADGVIVGSALMRILVDNQVSYSKRMDLMVEEARAIKEAINS